MTPVSICNDVIGPVMLGRSWMASAWWRGVAELDGSTPVAITTKLMLFTTTPSATKQDK